MKDIYYLQRDNKDLWKTFDMDQYFTRPNFALLDFGCNRSNFLRHAYRTTGDRELKFLPMHYHGMDLNLASIEEAKKNYPRAAPRIVHYNKYHRSYNPEGVKGLKASQVFDKKFNLILAYSVFTHCTVDETRETLLDLATMLEPLGSILFTMWLSDSLEGYYNYSMASNNLEKTPERTYNLVQKPFEKCLYWIDLKDSVADVDHFESDNIDSFGIFYKDIRSVMSIAPGIEYLGKPDVVNQYQHLFRFGFA